MDTNRITKESLINKMKDLSDIYDIVRLVEPKNTSVVMLGDNQLKITDHKPCFSVWNKDKRCDNCISLRACVENKRFTKFEFRNDEVYSVLAKPYTIIDEDKEIKVSLELVNRVYQDTVLMADGNSEHAKQIIEFNFKLYYDSLTGAYNRRYFDEHRYFYESSNTIPKKLGYLIADINHFKKINDTYGHKHGDEVLAKVVEIFKTTVRKSDCVIRVGGDEFLIVLQNCDKQFVDNIRSKLKQAVSMLHFPWLKDINLSVAIGMAYTDNFSGKQEELTYLYKYADTEMYADKKLNKSKGNGVSILAVSHAKSNRTLVKKAVEGRYMIMEAANDVEALTILNSNQINLIISDVSMNSSNGYEFMEKVKSNSEYRDIPIIAITDNTETSQRQSIESGANICLELPLNDYDLLDSIQVLTGVDFGRRELFDIDFLLETIPGAVVIYKIHGSELEVASCSRGINRISGWESDEFCYSEVSKNEQMIFPADLQRLRNAMEHIVRTHSRADIVYRAYKKDGSLVWLWLQGRYICEEDGCSIVEALLLDVTANTDMYRQILDETNAMVTIIDAETYEVIYANNKALETYPKVDEYVGGTCYKVIYNAEKPCKDCLLSKSMDVTSDVTKVTYNGRTYKVLKKRMLWNNKKVLLDYAEDIT